MFRRPCNIPQVLSARYQLFLGAFVLWVLWYGNDEGHMCQVLVGGHMLEQTNELFIYHLYMEADRVMENVEYCAWLLEQIMRGAIDWSQMLDDLFLARGVYLWDIVSLRQFHLGNKWVVLFAWLSYCVTVLWVTFRRPCNIPQVLVGGHMLEQTSQLFIYHLYMEADRVMENVEYCELLLQEIKRGAIVATQMLDDLFLARGM
ncbi:hypothetical protein BUALT_Bualt17G0082400 [Buddleja alternifolia]|uniref:Uncharacterized protein n=1 Tax=Buddleja alternifolia TaxID=168488 RepID=A0AAV6W4X0_9LAMI|nr:hypothetical protein BUALT_Bualt17G0082400 [Buddleja alternifolia]